MSDTSEQGNKPESAPGQEGKEFNEPKTMVNDTTGDVQTAETHEEMKNLQAQGYHVQDDEDELEAEPK